MGYFSNATEHECYETALCSRCRNFPGSDAPLCAVMQLHAEHNYGQLDSDDVSKARKALLDQLIPIDKETGRNAVCRMFNSIDNGEEFVFHLERGVAKPENLVRVIRSFESAVKFFAEPGDGMELTRIEKPNGQELY